MGSVSRVFGAGGILAGAAIAFAGCTVSGPADFDPESVIGPGCSVASEQRQTFMAKVSSLPLQLDADASFSDAERASVTQAVEQWNQLGQTLMGGNFFELRFTAVPGQTRGADPRDCGSDEFGTSNRFAILRETSERHWRGLGFSGGIPGATLRCFSGPRVNHQVIMVYVSVIPGAQLASVLTHELGHSLGLDHSCTDGEAKPQFLSCHGLGEDHPYHQAVMYPSLRMGHAPLSEPEMKDQLRENDTLRAGCLYGSTH